MEDCGASCQAFPSFWNHFEVHFSLFRPDPTSASTQQTLEQSWTSNLEYLCRLQSFHRILNTSDPNPTLYLDLRKWTVILSNLSSNAMQSSSKPTTPKPAKPVKKQKQQLITAMFPLESTAIGSIATGSTATGNSFSSALLKHVTFAPPVPDPIKAKYIRDPKSLTVAELKTLLRREGKPVSGRKAALLDRLLLDDDDLSMYSMDEDGNPLPPRDMSPSISHPLRIIPYDGKGRDPARCVGLRIKRVDFDPVIGSPEFILHTDKGRVKITHLDSASRYAELKVDKVLLEALDAVERMNVTWYVGDEEMNTEERDMQKKKGGNLLIVEAAVGMRMCPDNGEYRVVGIRCEGMQEMGFVFSEDSTLEDEFGRDPRFGDVAVKFAVSKSKVAKLKARKLEKARKSEAAKSKTGESKVGKLEVGKSEAGKSDALNSQEG